MSTSVSTSFVTQYERDVHDVFQLEGSYLKPTVRWKPDVIGSSTIFQKIGKGTATTKARHGTITPMNQTHTAITCTMSDFYAGDYVDRLDEAKLTIDERKALARGGAYALGRKVDEQIMTALDSTSQTAVTWTLTNIGDIRTAMMEMVGDLIANDAFHPERCYGILSPKAWEMAMSVPQFASADYVGPGGMEYTKDAPVRGRFKMFGGVRWMVHSANPGVGTATSKVFVYNQDAIGYGAGKFPGNIAAANGSPVGADITWVGERAAHFINHAMSGGACLIDDTGVIEGNLNDTGSVPSS